MKLSGCLDFNGYFKRLNPAWERTLGFTVQRHTNTRFSHGICPGCYAAVVEPQLGTQDRE
jgi:hypothetical protein